MPSKSPSLWSLPRGERRGSWMIHHSTLKTGATLALIPLLWGTHAPVAKACLQGLSPGQLVSWNLILGGAGLWIFMGRSCLRTSRTLPRTLWPVVFIQSLFGTTVYFGALYASFSLTDSVIRANLINYLFPVITVLLCVALGCERLTRARALGLLIAFVGAGSVVTRGRVSEVLARGSWGPDLLAFAAACSWGLFSAMGRRYQIPAHLSQWVGLTTGSIVAIPLLWVEGPGRLSGWGWLGVAYIAICSNALAGVIWLHALQKIHSTLVANTAYLSVVISSVCLWAFFGEEINLFVGLGLCLIVTGAVLSGR